MKCKVKGLVFVGFAAAILAGAAHAGDESIVTSKAYTDATYQAKTAANNAGKVLKMNTDEAGDIGYTDVTSTYTAGTFGGNTTGGNLVTESAVAAAIAAAGAGEDDSFELTSNKLSGGASGTGSIAGNASDSTKYTSAKAVADYVTDVLADNGTAGSGYQHTSTADFQVGGANGTWKTVTDGTYTTAGSDGNGGFKVDVNALNGTGTNNFANVSGGTGEDTNKLPTAAAVKAYVDSKATSDLSGKQDKTGATSGYKVGDSDGAWADMARAVTAATGGYVSVTGGTDGAAVAINIDNNKIDNTVTSGSSNLVTSDAVYDALNGAQHSNFQTYSDTPHQISNGTGGWEALDSTINATTAAAGTAPTTGAVKSYVDSAIASQPASNIPAQSATVCTTNTPCALVAAADGYHWITMATGTHQGGVCGDAGGGTCGGMGTNPNA